MNDLNVNLLLSAWRNLYVLRFSEHLSPEIEDEVKTSYLAVNAAIIKVLGNPIVKFKVVD